MVVSHHIFYADGCVSACSLSSASSSQCELHRPQEMQSRLNGALEVNRDAVLPTKTT